MADRDALAITYSRQNAELNGLEGVKIFGSLGYDDVKNTDFDLIVSNIPGKAGKAVITYLLRDAAYYLAPGGVVAIVVVAALEPTVEKILQNIHGLGTVFKQKRSGHIIFHYRYSVEIEPPMPHVSGMERGIYHRSDIKVRLDELEYTMQTAYGLPEFDRLNYGSEMLITALNNPGRQETKRAIIFNPGQGHIPVAVWKILHPLNIELVDRDLLALRYSRLNLIQNGFPPEKITTLHQVSLGEKENEEYDFIAGALREEGQKADFSLVHQAAEQLIAGGRMIISGGSTPITRMVAYIESERILHITARERRRGYSLLVLEKKA